MSKYSPAYVNKEQDRRLALLEEKFVEVGQHYNEEIGKIKIDIATIKANQKINLGVMFIILTAIVGLFLK